MKKIKADRWLVMEGRPVYSCRTRKQARKYAKKQRKRIAYPEFVYVGKCFDSQHKIVLDV